MQAVISVRTQIFGELWRSKGIWEAIKLPQRGNTSHTGANQRKNVTHFLKCYILGADGLAARQKRHLLAILGRNTSNGG